MTRRRELESLAPTVTVDEASATRWDVIVGGAGPAGTVAARQLALHGASVLLIDRASFPRWKVCGCCFNGAALGALASLGLGDLAGRLGAVPLSRMHLAVGAANATLPLPRGVVLSREALDSALIREAIGAGAAFLSGADAVALPDAGDRRAVRLRCDGDERTTSGKLLIAADGLGGTFLRKIEEMAHRIKPGSPIGAGAVLDDAPGFFEPGTIFMACGRGVYVGASRLEDGRLDVAAALSGPRLRRERGIGTLLTATLGECGFAIPDGLAEAGWRGTPPLTRSRRRLAHHRLFVVGDSAGYVEPFTGEGVSWAIQAAVLLSSHVFEALERWSDDLPAKWESHYRRFFNVRKRTCVLVSVFLRHHLLARATVGLLGRTHRLASPWVKTISSLDPEVQAIAERTAR